MTRVLFIGLFLVAGCSAATPPPPPVNAPETVSPRHLAALHGSFRQSHRGRPPKDEAEFKEYIKGLGEGRLASLGIANLQVDALFVSPRDGQPYEVRYNDAAPAAGGKGPPAVVVERVGKDGKRMVAYSTLQVEEIDDAQYQKVRFSKS
jgi:hypothetical protein